MAKPVKVPIAKAGPDAFVEIDIEAIPGVEQNSEAWDYVILRGLMAIAEDNKATKAAGLTGLTKLSGAELAAAHARSLEISKKNFADLLAGKVKAKRGKSASSDETLPREVQTEARRIARGKIADFIRARNLPQDAYTAKQKTEAADAYIKANPEVVAQAKANVAAAKSIKQPEGIEFSLDSLGIKPDEAKITAAAEKKAAAAAKKAEKAASKPLSAKQAGMTTKRSKPKAAEGAAPAKLVEDNANFLAALQANHGKVGAASHTAH
jgi:hypothetical protein